MQERNLGLTALSVAAVAMGLYAMVAGIALLLGGALGTFAGSDAGVAVMVLGAILFGNGMAAYFVGYGFWMSKSWSWAGGLVTASVTVVSVLAMGLIGASYTSLVLPVVLGLSLIWYLLRPSVRSQLISDEATVVEADQADASPGVRQPQTEVAAEPGM